MRLPSSITQDQSRAEQCHSYGTDKPAQVCVRVGAQQVCVPRRGGVKVAETRHASTSTRQIISRRPATRTLPSGVTSRGDLPATARAPGQSPPPTSLLPLLLLLLFPHPCFFPLPPSPSLSHPTLLLGFLIIRPTETVVPSSYCKARPSDPPLPRVSGSCLVADSRGGGGSPAPRLGRGRAG